MEYDELEYNQACELFECIKSFIRKIIESVKILFKRLVQTLKSTPGLKRLIKRQQLEYYESISGDKSNNWRKVHGLPLRRKIKNKIDYIARFKRIKHAVGTT